MNRKQYTAIILAAQRPGVTNPIAKHFGVSHKCVVEVNGTPMIERVIENLRACEHISRIVISIESPSVLHAIPSVKSLVDAGTISFTKSQENLYTSILHAVKSTGLDKMPYLVTTADNCFHTPEMIEYFLGDIDANDAEAAWGMTPDSLVQSTYPGTGKITGQHKLRDGIWSNCNIYAVGSEHALNSIEIFKGGGQFGNKKKRRAMIPMVGLWAFFLYRFGITSLDGLARQASKVFKIHAHAVKMPFADAPIDADDLPSFNFIEQHLVEREGNAPST